MSRRVSQAKSHRTILQDIRLLASGKAAQRAGEVERDLDKADGMIRLLFNDVQTLKDGRHPQGEQMYRRYVPYLGRLVRRPETHLTPLPNSCASSGFIVCMSVW